MDDQSTMPFGKHRGLKLEDVPHGYWIHMYDRKKLNAAFKKYAEETVPVLGVQARQEKKPPE